MDEVGNLNDQKLSNISTIYKTSNIFYTVMDNDQKNNNASHYTFAEEETKEARQVPRHSSVLFNFYRNA